MYSGTGVSCGVRRTTWERSPKNWELQIPCLKSFSGSGTRWDSSLLVSLTLWDTPVRLMPPLPLTPKYPAKFLQNFPPQNLKNRQRASAGAHGDFLVKRPGVLSKVLSPNLILGRLFPSSKRYCTTCPPLSLPNDPRMPKHRSTQA